MAYIFNKLVAQKLPRKLRAQRLHASFLHRKALFVHIPKAAGSSVCLSLFGHQVGHKKVCDYYFADRKTVQSLFKFTFVRDPFTRFQSSFRFLKSGSPFLSDEKMHQKLQSFADVNEFCEAFLKQPDQFKSPHFVPQYRFLNYTGSAKDKQIAVDFVGKFESLSQDYNSVCRQLGVANPLQEVNQTASQQSLDLNPANKEGLRNYYDSDFYLFGYNL
ncbi:MAG: sulfotransferase family 2 domain-containing protein [Pseudomonadota bacterium]